jgi:hypothetical protein
MGYKAIRIDELTIDDHYFIEEDDKCFYMMEYTKGAGNGTPENSRIHNFKKSMEYNGSSHWHYKEEAIQSLARLFRTIYLPMLDLPKWTLIPIPPSKCKADPLHDDRMLRLLTLACRSTDCDIRELIITKGSVEASHQSKVRPSVADLQNNLMLDPELVKGVSHNIILFDDVLTSGAHYRACKNILLNKFPKANIYAMFIARRVLPPADDPFDF